MTYQTEKLECKGMWIVFAVQEAEGRCCYAKNISEMRFGALSSTTLP